MRRRLHSSAAPTRLRQRALVALWCLYALFWIGGIGSYLMLGAPPRGSEWAAPAFLWLGGALMLAHFSRSDALRLMLVGLLGWIAECIGVHTGYPFGHYQYTDALGLSMAGAPLAMIPAWILLAGYAMALGSRMGIKNRWATAVFGACWMTSVDLIIDPLAAGPLGYWTWSNPGFYFGIPATNFMGWLVTSAILLSIVGISRVPQRGADWVGASVLAFFSVIAVGVEGYRGLTLLGLALLATQLFAVYSAQSRPARRSTRSML